MFFNDLIISISPIKKFLLCIWFAVIEIRSAPNRAEIHFSRNLFNRLFSLSHKLLPY